MCFPTKTLPACLFQINVLFSSKLNDGKQLLSSSFSFQNEIFKIKVFFPFLFFFYTVLFNRIRLYYQILCLNSVLPNHHHHYRLGCFQDKEIVLKKKNFVHFESKKRRFFQCWVSKIQFFANFFATLFHSEKSDNFILGFQFFHPIKRHSKTIIIIVHFFSVVHFSAINHP